MAEKKTYKVESPNLFYALCVNENGEYEVRQGKFESFECDLNELVFVNGRMVRLEARQPKFSLRLAGIDRRLCSMRLCGQDIVLFPTFEDAVATENELGWVDRDLNYPSEHSIVLDTMGLGIGLTFDLIKEQLKDHFDAFLVPYGKDEDGGLGGKPNVCLVNAYSWDGRETHMLTQLEREIRVEIVSGEVSYTYDDSRYYPSQESCKSSNTIKCYRF